ncbi:unnamed protein product [Spirodela intermedia]|uniref:40S ribosomal protein S7 n=1 Tax=Spirodela intermedia TaxID=51605 RepID=A0A7I8INV1_SPIIN|nr:unnamed protein product [Spirodela intermedia]CAA6659528.1 unnamed protein product [Spirodela intermedia]
MLKLFLFLWKYVNHWYSSPFFKPQGFFDLDNSNQELRTELKDLFINSAIYPCCQIVIHVPYRLRKALRKIQIILVRELGKKFSGKDVVFTASRRILRPPMKGSAVVRPRNRTLTAVDESMLEDIVFPAEIVGKRILLDPKERNSTESKLCTFAGCLPQVVGQDVVFEYPWLSMMGASSIFPQQAGISDSLCRGLSSSYPKTSLFDLSGASSLFHPTTPKKGDGRTTSLGPYQ